MVAPARLQEAGIVVSASRSPKPYFAGDSTQSLSLMGAEEIRIRQTRDIADILRDVPGVAVSAIPGQTQLRLRGSEGNHVLVLVDGIEVSDPFAGEFDMGTLQAEIGSRVEVLRGPQSALHGSDAIGGVIAYHSALGEGSAARFEAGSRGTFNASVRAGVESDAARLAVNATLVSRDGAPNARGGTRDIGRDSYTLSARGEAQAAHNFSLHAAARLVRSLGDFNQQDFDPASPTLGLIVDTPGVGYENDAFYGLLGMRLEAFGGKWTHDLSAQMADISRDTFGPSGRASGQSGARYKASYVNTVNLARAHSLTLAADIEREEFRNRDPSGSAFGGLRSARNIGLVGEYRWDSDSFDVSAAIRRDLSNRFADTTTFKLGAGYDLTRTTRIRASIGSGIKNPGFFELYGFFDGRFIGNADLQPEKSTEWEVGLDQQIGSVRLAATYFDAELEGEIYTRFPAPTFIATPANRTTKSTRRGIEVSARARFGEFSAHGAYSYLNAREDGVREVRRPKHLASLGIDWQARRKAASAGFVIRHNGAATDLAFTDPSFVPSTVSLADYTLVNLYGAVRLSKGLRAFGRIENVLDETYEQVFSFVSQGRTARIGISAEF